MRLPQEKTVKVGTPVEPTYYPILPNHGVLPVKVVVVLAPGLRLQGWIRTHRPLAFPKPRRPASRDRARSSLGQRRAPR